MLNGETFAVFALFHSITNLFSQIMALSISNIDLQACNRERFPVNSHFSTPDVFFPLNVLPYTV